MPRESPEMWTRIERGPHEDEAGRNLGPFTVVLDKHLLEQQNAKKLYGPKTNCAAGVNSGEKIQKDQKKKNQLPLLKRQEQKQGTVHAEHTTT